MFKKFSIIATIVASLIVIMVVIFGCLRINNGLKIKDPDSIIVYAKSTVAVGEYSKDNAPETYETIKNLYNNLTNLTMFDYMLSKNSIDTKPTQDLKNEFKQWTNTNKQSGYCVEFIYNVGNKQSVVVTVDGDTKVIEFYGLIMQVEESNDVQKIALYFSTSTGSSKTYSDSPIVVIGKQNELFKYVSSL